MPWRRHLFARVVGTILGSAIALTAANSVRAQSEEDPAEKPNPLDAFGQLTKVMDNQSWDDEHTRIERAVDSLWKARGWNTEADRFARDLAMELAKIPPWEPLRRLNLFTERLAGRYGVDETQAAQLQASILKEAGRFLVKHGPTVLEHMQEGMRTSAEGKPFTREQVARWSEVGRPILADLREGMNRVADELVPHLDAEHRQLLGRDRESFAKRQRYVDTMTKRWAAGEWDPADWGLEEDPYHKREVGPQGAKAAADTKRPAPAPVKREVAQKLPKCLAHDPSTWFAYVITFGDRFQLDPGQKNTADSIHAEILARAEAYQEKRAEALEKIAPNERGKHEAYAPIRILFAELEARLDAIPTSSQRDRAGK